MYVFLNLSILYKSYFYSAGTSCFTSYLRHLKKLNNFCAMLVIAHKRNCGAEALFMYRNLRIGLLKNLSSLIIILNER